MEEDSIYFFLSSIDSLNFHPNNKAYNFTVEVPERANLIGDWEVGICDFHATTVTNETLFVFRHCGLLLRSKFNARYNKIAPTKQFK